MTAALATPMSAADARPEPRGERSAWLLDLLAVPPERVRGVETVPDPEVDDPLADDDLALALTLAHQLHYDGLPGVDDRWEWHPRLLTAVGRWEDRFERALREQVDATGGDVVETLSDLANGDGGRSTSAWLAEHGALWHVREEAVHRSLYQRREADPHTFGIPRLRGEAKAALVRIQKDEYGDGELADIHAELFAHTMEGLGLDPTPFAYVDHAPAATLATNALVTLFGKHRRLRGALMGHLALFEMASVPVMTRMAETYSRLGLNSWTRLFFDVHVVADAEHQAVALHDLAGNLADAEPGLAADIVFGARALAHLEARLTRHVLDAWERDRTSLRRPVPDAPLPGTRDVPLGVDPRSATVS